MLRAKYADGGDSPRSILFWKPQAGVAGLPAET